jgi:hypothetical protein
MRKFGMLIALTSLAAGVAACGHETTVVRRETVQTQTVPAPVVRRETTRVETVPADPVVTEQRTIIQTEPAQPQQRVYEKRTTTVEHE